MRRNPGCRMRFRQSPERAKQITCFALSGLVFFSNQPRVRLLPNLPLIIGGGLAPANCTMRVNGERPYLGICCEGDECEASQSVIGVFDIGSGVCDACVKSAVHIGKRTYKSGVFPQMDSGDPV
jgi:hypothetical protein